MHSMLLNPAAYLETLMTHPYEYGHLRLVRRQEPGTTSPEKSKQGPAPRIAARHTVFCRFPAVLKTGVYVAVLAGLVGFQPLITLASFELVHSYGMVAGLSAWVTGSAVSIYALLGHLHR